MRSQLRLASTIQPMPRDRRLRTRLRARELAMVGASMLGLALAIANYVL